MKLDIPDEAVSTVYHALKSAFFKWQKKVRSDATEGVKNSAARKMYHLDQLIRDLKKEKDK